VTQRLLAIVTDAVEGPEPIEALCREEPDELEVRVVMPAVEESRFRAALGDVDEPSRDAEQRLEASLRELRGRGIEASGAVGDPDPVLAAQDALREAPADEVVIVERAPAKARWFEDGLFERAREELSTPLKLILVEPDGEGPTHVVGVERAAPQGAGGEGDRGEKTYENLPRFTKGDLGGMVIGILGTIVVIILAGASPGPQTAAGAAAMLIAMGVALINMAHVVGLTLFESIPYRGGFETFFRRLALIGTPIAVAVNLAIALWA
jgi:hypothetical protein